MKKGFTLVELLAIIVILAMIAFITWTGIIKRITNAKKDGFKDAVFVAIDAYKAKESYDDFVDLGEVNISDLPLEKSSLKSGKVKRNSDNIIIAVNITDGNYCANGSKKNLVITDGNCQ